MRTTITLEKDVAARIERLKKTRPFKQLVNDALRAGLDQIDAESKETGRYSLIPVEGRPRRTDLDNVAELLAEVEGDTFPLILIDANLLIYAKFSDLPQHVRAREWLEGELNTPGKVGLPWQTSLAFLRLATNPRLFGRPLGIQAAWEQVSEWLKHPRVWIPEPTENHPQVLGEILRQVQATGNLVPDAHLAAIAIEHGLTVCSADSDFARFPSLSWRNPLTS